MLLYQISNLIFDSSCFFYFNIFSSKAQVGRTDSYRKTDARRLTKRRRIGIMIQTADERQRIQMNGRCFQVWQISAGWFRGCITDSQTKILFDNSWMTNFPEDLMLAILSALGGLPDERDKTVFYAELEPARAKWALSADNETISVHVTNYEDDSPTAAVIGNQTAVFDKNLFLRDFTAEMNDVLQRFGLLGYRSEWGAEFPMSLYLKIKDLAAGQQTISCDDEVPAADNMGEEAVCSDFAAERRMLDLI